MELEVTPVKDLDRKTVLQKLNEVIESKCKEGHDSSQFVYEDKDTKTWNNIIIDRFESFEFSIARFKLHLLFGSMMQDFDGRKRLFKFIEENDRFFAEAMGFIKKEGNKHLKSDEKKDSVA